VLLKYLRTAKLPSMALDTGIHAGMTALMRFSCWSSIRKCRGRSTHFPVLSRSSHRYTPMSVRRRRSGRDAGTQAQGGETLCYSSTWEPPSYRPWHWIPASMPAWRC